MPKTARQIALASEHLHAGNLPRARALFRKALHRDPENPEAWHLLGVALAASNDLNGAVATIAKAIDLAGPEPAWCANLGRVLHRMGRYGEASACFRQALAASPMNGRISLELGICLRAAGELKEACLALELAARLEPCIPEGWFHLGRALYETGDLEGAQQAYRQAALLEDNAQTHFHLGVAQMAAQAGSAAMKSFERVLEAEPAHAEALNNIGLLLHDRGDLKAAVQSFEKAVELRSGDYYAAEYNLARALLAGHQLEQAARVFREAVTKCPEHVDARLGLARSLTELGEPALAEPHLRAAAGLAPGSATANLNLSINLLQLGRWAEAWPYYQWRLKAPGAKPRTFEQPEWTGAPLEGRRILLHAEQGLGDTLQFIRYLPLVRSRGGVPIIQCQTPVAGLIGTLEGAGEVVAEGAPLPRFDCHVPLISLPGIFQSEPGRLPADTPYLFAETEAVEIWAARLRRQVEPALLRVGLTWAGNESNAYERVRSIPLEELDALSDLDGVAWFDMQKEEARARPSFPLHPMIGDCANFADNAAALLNLDLLISADTAMAHLAGSLGRPVWLLLPHAADWRWLTGRGDTPWYPSMRLFRQAERGNWGNVIAEVKQELARMAPAGSTPAS